MKISTRLLCMLLGTVVIVASFSYLVFFTLSNSHVRNSIHTEIIEMGGLYTNVFVANTQLISISDPQNFLETWSESMDVLEDSQEVFIKTLKSSKLFQGDSELQYELDKIALGLNFIRDKKDEVSMEIIELAQLDDGYLPPLLNGAIDGRQDLGDAINRIQKIGQYLDILYYDKMQYIETLVTDQLERRINGRLSILLPTIAIAVILNLFISVLLFFGIQKSISTLFIDIEKIREKDLSKGFVSKSKDEIGVISKSLNSFIGNLREVFESITQVYNTASEQREDISAVTIESSTAVNETKATIDSVSKKSASLISVIKDTTNSFTTILNKIENQNSLISDQAGELKDSSDRIEKIDISISDISKLISERVLASNDQVALTKAGNMKVVNLSKLVELNSADSKEVLNIVGIINDISERINLLSMNAAIEAAHAGDMGKGFTVVAAEIRKLAESTNKNSKGIEDFLKRIAKRTDETLKSTSETVSFMKLIETESSATSDSLTLMNDHIQSIVDRSRMVRKTMETLSKSSGEVNTGAQLIEQEIVTSQNGLSLISDNSIDLNHAMTEIVLAMEEINIGMVKLTDMNMQGEESMVDLKDKVEVFHYE